VSSQIQQAREALGARLREIRKDARHTGRALAALAGWHPAKITKIEHGRQNPTEDDLRVWCTHCDATGQLSDLIATLRGIETAHLEWRRQLRTGLRRGQETAIPLYERTSLFRIYQPYLIPGLFQTPEYATAVMRNVRAFLGLPDDVDEAVAVRMERQRVLYRGDRRFLVVLEEEALRTQAGSTDVMAGQLDRLMTVMGLHRVSIGIIPSATVRDVWPAEAFFVFDDLTVRVETVSALLTITQPHEIALYAKTFHRFQDLAVYGPAARRLIVSALDGLGAI
jgi:transcriptional regulator with XRE-family HTH domain